MSMSGWFIAKLNEIAKTVENRTASIFIVKVYGLIRSVSSDNIKRCLAQFCLNNYGIIDDY